MRLVQFIAEDGKRRVAWVQNPNKLWVLRDCQQRARPGARGAREQIAGCRLVQIHLAETIIDYEPVVAERRLLPPLDHPDPAHCLCHRHRADPPGQRQGPRRACTPAGRSRQGAAHRLHAHVPVGAGGGQAGAGQDWRAAGMVLQGRRQLHRRRPSSRWSCRPSPSMAARKPRSSACTSSPTTATCCASALPWATSFPTTSWSGRTTSTWRTPSCAPARWGRSCWWATCRRASAGACACCATAPSCGRPIS